MVNCIRNTPGRFFGRDSLVISATRYAPIAIALGASASAMAQDDVSARRCSIPQQIASKAPKRGLVVDDLIRLRDFGSMGYDGRPFALSPDGSRIALALRQADADRNDHCTAIIEIPLSHPSRHRLIDSSGLLQRATYAIHGVDGIPLGIPRPVQIAWSPDGKQLAYSKSFKDRTEIWVAGPRDWTGRKVANSSAQIDAMTWSGPGNSIVYASRPALDAIHRDQRKEGMSGFRYDGRFWPLAASTPFASGAIPVAYKSVDVDSRREREALPDEVAQLTQRIDPATPENAKAFARLGVMTAWTAQDDPDAFRQPPRLHARANGLTFDCEAETCTNVADVWLFRQGKRVVFLRREGPAYRASGIYSWTPGSSNSPRPLLQSDDMLFGCQATGRSLICARETSTRPRHIVQIDIETGRLHEVFDPNPEFHEIQLGSVRRLAWKNSFGLETFGDLVLPAEHDARRPLPLIIVQYDSRGFLRGGTGDEYPVHFFAAHGFAVLSFNRPIHFGMASGKLSYSDMLIANMKDWADRRSVQSSLETIVGRLIAEGIVDPKSIGITGQSDGATTTTFALIHSNLFAAAAISTCCEDESVMTSLGPGIQKSYASMGYPLPGSVAPEFWNENSLLHHADRTPVPILIQAGSEEFRMALPTYEILRNKGWPIEMYVFPEEGHVKFQPAHRRAIYLRSVEWMERQLIRKPTP